MKNTERFSSRVDNYVKYRPHYPDALIPYLEKEAGLLKTTIVADIGAGTGISALPFLHNGNPVMAVEPNAEMRERMISLLQRYPQFTAITGTAERTTLPDHSVDLIVAGQAFHWFDAAAAKAEFRRIARPGAHVALIWNKRSMSTPFEKDYEKLLQRFGTDYKEVNHKNVGASQLANFFAPHPYIHHTFQNAQLFDFTGLKGRLLSSSYAPDEHHPAYTPMIKALEDIFEQHQENRMVKFHYDTQLYLGPVG
ncbi:class I SAM-dependent methyltransferase [Chitinophaga vietnamensis]|uniref:class I SAM-dependent methyltransferase n=1 Tax=Chitinophaga vietnamensis TaxID=2593957 RepID=UPI00117804BA|nr:class I SAM-dependent methyltransferase [Chitinophaga vietnamensis]